MLEGGLLQPRPQKDTSGWPFAELPHLHSMTPWLMLGRDTAMRFERRGPREDAQTATDRTR